MKLASSVLRWVLLVTFAQVPWAGTVDAAAPTMSVKGFHACAIENAALVCWGWNAFGQLGDGSNDEAQRPVPVQGLGHGVADVSTGFFHTCAVVDGGVQCWGANDSRQLGTGDDADSLIPVQVASLGSSSGATAVAAGASHACAIVDGGLRCWGDNSAGQIGSGVVGGTQATPYEVFAAGSNVTAVAAGLRHTCAIVGGALWCWGDNSEGELGLGNFDPQPAAPAMVPLFSSGTTAVTAGTNDTCAVLDGRHLFCWGLNHRGQLGDGSTTRRSTPTSVLDGSSIVAVSAGGFWSASPFAHTCAVVDGAPKCWGSNGRGQLGDGSRHDSLLPVNVMVPEPVASVSAGYSQSCATAVSRRRYCWGSDDDGELGNGGLSSIVLTPTVSEQLYGSLAGLSAGDAHACGIGAQRIFCWGANDVGQLGVGTTYDHANSVTYSFPALQSPSLVAAGGAHTCAASAGGQSTYCWGTNDHGQLGGDFADPSLMPNLVSGLDGSVGALSSGGQHTCAVVDVAGGAQGGIRCWGRGDEGQLGNFTFADSTMPVTVVRQNSGFNVPVLGATEVSAGADHTCALVHEGVQCWGGNAAGQLGNNSYTHSSRAVSALPADSGVRQVAVGEQFSCAIVSTSGLVECWGRNEHGQLGDGTESTRPVPGLVKIGPANSASAMIMLAAGKTHACALRLDGGVWCWGDNAYGQLGNGARTDSLYAIQALLPAGSGVTEFAAGEDFTCASSPTQTWCWGYGFRGRLGNGNLGYSTTPVLVDWLFADGFD